ncbi:alpha/beta hydrolase [Pelomonas sp. SE-A7]|uniref:alpha/beta hydrolase family protein n=1 Tax=Pelomonas sp. SE-A7 TaxID=3054953 RepID=UPI00259C6BF5|nr:alpha/beta hydrolase [Pelomonas sp. SE-A7]MDM4766276.1 alpha/beta hydrolase [Pelomonas sp. SE-A7]
MRRASILLLTGLLASLIVACGGGGAGSGSQPGSQPQAAEPVLSNASGPGEHRRATSLGRVTITEFQAALAGNAGRAPPLQPRYAVSSWRIEYRTTDADGVELTASALIALPDKALGAASPLLLYQHGTIFHDADAPSNHATADEPALLMASLGYVVLATDYVGYGTSKGVAHPYLLADPVAASVVDALTASRYWLQTQGRRLNGQLFLTGYSEGGHVTLAAQRALQVAGKQAGLVATAAGAGPYDVMATLDWALDHLRDEEPLLAALINPGFLKHLGSGVRKEVRKQLLKQAIPDDADVVFRTDFIDLFLDDQRDAIVQRCNVADWLPRAPMALFHGREDRTVPFVNAQRAFDAMKARGATPLSLTECQASPADHLPCVRPYWEDLLQRFGALARDL